MTIGDEGGKRCGVGLVLGLLEQRAAEEKSISRREPSIKENGQVKGPTALHLSIGQDKSKKLLCCVVLFYIYQTW